MAKRNFNAMLIDKRKIPQVCLANHVMAPLMQIRDQIASIYTSCNYNSLNLSSSISQSQIRAMRIQAMKQYLLAILASSNAGISAFEFQKPVTEAQRTISQPLLGFGTWNLKVSPENTSAAVSIAIQTGYRKIDCAAAYGNEKAVGEGIANALTTANLTRDQIWVTSKLWNDQ
jgi:hypothetical protein